MAHKDVFCNVPWTNLHIYWDGSFGMCCAENGKPYNQGNYNIKTMPVVDWYNSQPMRDVRKAIIEDKKLPICVKCYRQELVGYESRRYRENFKTAIFTEQSFDKSLAQSPIFPIISQSKELGYTSSIPIDWHIDLGNECNLACKMCFPDASSKIAIQYKNWGLIDKTKSTFTNWTDDDQSWINFLTSIDQTIHLNRLHFMGGEPLLNKRFESLLKHLIDTKRHNTVSISFVSNGTIYKQSIIDKLKKFKSCDIEISIESFDKTNDYIRQGSVIDNTIKNIEKILDQKTNSFNVVLRSVPQLLNVNSYYKYIEWCLDKKVSVQGILLKDPPYLQISVLPTNIKNSIKEKYISLKETLEKKVNTSFSSMPLGRDISRLESQLLREVNTIINLLDEPSDINVEQQRQQLVKWLSKWDAVYNLDAREYYPEYKEFLEQYGYGRI